MFEALVWPMTRLERFGFAALAACLLSPVVAHGLWRPLEHLFGSAGSAPQVTWSALAVCVSTAVVRWFCRDRTLGIPLLLGALVAAGLSAGLSLGGAGLGALLPVALTTAWLLHALPARLPPALDGLAGRHRRLALLYVLAASISVVWTARLGIFIGDPAAVDHQALPGETFTETHSCLTAYVRASELARQGVDDFYADAWWHGSLGLPALPAGSEDPWRPFHLDNFNYPPPFLLLASPLAPLDGDFLAQRALWFGLNGLLAAFGLWVVARWVGGPAAHRVLLLAPLVFGSMPFLLTLQVGNFHLAATVLSVLAMVAFDRGRAATGGALLATAILSKVSPGVLGIVLLLQRRVRESVLAAGFGAGLVALTLAVYGPDPIVSFVTVSLPNLSSGAAFPQMDTPAGIATNMSPFGVPFKLELLGFDVGDPWHVGRVVARVYTVGLLLVTVAGARRRGDRRDQAIRWMALLVLAAMQSPFSPGYSTLALLWATSLLSVEVRRARHAVALLALWPAILLVPQGMDPAAQAALSIAQTALTLGVSAWLVVRPPGLAPEPAR